MISDPNRYTARAALLSVLVLSAFACGSDGDPPNPPDPPPPTPICAAGDVVCKGASVAQCAADELSWTVLETCSDDEICQDGACVLEPDETYGIASLVADPPTLVEGEADEVALTATFDEDRAPTNVNWRQLGGPKHPINGQGSGGAKVDTSSASVGGDTVLTFELSAEWDVESTGETVTDVATVDVVVQTAGLEPARSQGQIGGATVAAVQVEHAGQPWALFNQGGRLVSTPIGVADAPTHSLTIGAYIRDIEIVEHGAARYALLALATEGIAVVAADDLTAMQHLLTVRVNYEKLGVTFAEGGGDILTEDLASTRSRIAALASDGTSLFIANADYGLQRTSLANLLGAGGPVLEADGTLLIDAETYTQQYAGEHPWGGLLSLELHGGKLFAAQQYMGMGIFDAATLAQVGRYNMYVDASVTEDWFVDMNVATQVQSVGADPFLDDVTGMPDYRQANFEIQEVWHAGIEAPTPWADFDRYGKFYYASQDVAVADYGERTIAYIAYGLGGLVAVDVTGFADATPETFLIGDYLAYGPGIPAHGPDEKIPSDGSQSLYPYYGAGKLKEAGVTSATVVGDEVYYTDHFGGLVVLERADQPETFWRQAGGPFNNDRGLAGGPAAMGDHFPDYEFVTSYDMSPYDPTDHESAPTWMFQAPSLLITGEIGGHGRSHVILAGAKPNAAGGADVLYIAGAGGLAFLDLDLSRTQLPAGFSTTLYLPSTTEIGAAVDGSPTATISMGHTQGITSTPGYLYVGDGPHGMTVWDILDDEGNPIDDPRVVANTLQDEYPQEFGGTTVYPTTHAWGTIFDPTDTSVYVMCQSIGMRRVSVVAAEAGEGKPGAPILLAPTPADIFEHNGDQGSVGGLTGQDHAYDVFRRGDLAFVADGPNGLTIYDITKNPTDTSSGFVVGNVGSESGRPPLGRSTGVTVWTDEASDRSYAFVAAGQFGIGVVDVTDPAAPTLVKSFEPKKYEDDHVGHADGRSVDVHVVGDNVYFSYTSFGVLSYTIADLIAPLPEGIDPAKIFDPSGGFDYRPEYLAKFKLDELPGYEELDAEALYMEYTDIGGRLLFYVAYGEAGVVMLDWTDPAAPTLLAHAPTIHEATSVTLQNGRLYVADHDGGIVILR